MISPRFAQLLSLIAVLGLIAPAFAQPWRYVDKRGRVHYTNDPNKLPKNKRKRAQERLEKKRLREAARRAAAAPASVDGSPASVAPASLGSIAIPVPAAGAASADSKPKEPTAHEIWQEKMQAAEKDVADLGAELKTAQDDAQAARRKAIITPSGFNSDSHAKANARVTALEKKLADAQETSARTRKAEPPVAK